MQKNTAESGNTEVKKLIPEEDVISLPYDLDILKKSIIEKDREAELKKALQKIILNRTDKYLKELNNGHNNMIIVESVMNRIKEKSVKDITNAIFDNLLQSMMDNNLHSTLIGNPESGIGINISCLYETPTPANVIKHFEGNYLMFLSGLSAKAQIDYRFSYIFHYIFLAHNEEYGIWLSGSSLPPREFMRVSRDLL